MKTNNDILAFVCTAILHFTGAAQWKAGIEQYVYTNVPVSEAFVQLIHIQTPGNFYGELRYNYEEGKTISLFAGKTFSGGHDLEYELTPMAGCSTGRFTGFSLAANTDMEWKNFFFSSQAQYSKSVKRKDSLNLKTNAADFFYSWSELGYNFTEHFFTGVSLQDTRQAGENICEPGILAGFSIKKLCFPFYVFRPFRADRYFIMGITYQIDLKKRKQAGMQLPVYPYERNDVTL